MSKQIKLSAAERELTGKAAAGRLRREGQVPAVLYGLDRPTRSLQVDALELYHALHTPAGMNVLLELTAGDVKQLAMPKEVQQHPVRGDYIHVDLVRIDADVKINVEVPIHTVNDEEVKPGVVTVVLQALPIVVSPLEVPDNIVVDVDGLTIGDSIHCRDLTLPEGVELDIDPDRTAVTISAPTQVEEPETDEVDDEFAGEGEDPVAEGDAGEGDEAADSE